MSEHLNEMLVKENGAYYYVLPVKINKIIRQNTYDDGKFIRKYYSKEILDCLFAFFDICLIKPDCFIIQDNPNRDNNHATLTNLGFAPDDANLNRRVAKFLMTYLKPTDFVEDTYKFGTHAFIFKIEDYKKRIEGVTSSKNKQRSLYIKFSFIYNYKINDVNEYYRTVGTNRYGELVIKPKHLLLNAISFHVSRN